jgi:hypothetical protein
LPQLWWWQNPSGGAVRRRGMMARRIHGTDYITNLPVDRKTGVLKNGAREELPGRIAPNAEARAFAATERQGNEAA